MSIRRKLVLNVLGLLALSGVVLLLTLKYSLSGIFKDEVLKVAWAYGERLADDIVNPMITEDLLAVQLRVVETAQNDDLDYVFVTDQGGVPMAHSFGPEFPETLKPISGEAFAGDRHEERVLFNGMPFYDMAVKVMGDGIGVVHIGVADRRIEEYVNGILYKVGLIVFVVMGAGLALAFAFSFRVSKPIMVLARAAERLGAGGDFEPVPVESNDEIGHLAASFNAMSASLKKAEEDIRQSEANLRRIIESLPYCVMLIDKDKTIRYVNEATLRLAGCESLDQLAGQICHKTLCPAEADKCPIMDLGQRLDRSERVMLTLDGGKVPILKSVVPVEVGGEEMMLEAFMDISKIKATEKSLQDSIKEKDILLKEVHHRVKNNMAVISALLQMQSVYVKDADDRVMFNESQGRIKAMAIVHEQLYKTRSFADISVAEYVRSLAASVSSSHLGRREVNIEYDIDEVSLGLDTLIPCGLIVNELLTNAFKHAFNGETDPVVRISLKRVSETHVRLSVSDNGKGLPPDFDVNRTSGLGLQLITALSRQLQGSLEYGSDKGAVFTLTFPLSQ